MRTLTSTLQAAQIRGNLFPKAKIVLTLGATTYTYEAGVRVLVLDHKEEPFSQKATVLLDNKDNALSSLDLKGYKAVISYGAKTSAGDEYSACAPLWVIPQQLDSGRGADSAWSLDCTLQLKGIPDLLDDDKASGFYIPALTDTVKTVINGILGATISVFSHCTIYTVDWDSEDSLVDTYCPKQTVRITSGMSRLTALKLYLQYTRCMMMVQADGHVHIFVPKVTGTTWKADTVYAKGDHVIPTTPNNLTYRCSVAGTSGATEPTWPTAKGETVADNDVTWTAEVLDYTYSLPIGTQRTLTLRPNGAGDETAISSEYPQETDHYADVDEVVADEDTTYVRESSPSAYKRDLYALTGHTTESKIIRSVKIYFRIASGELGSIIYAKPSQKSGTIVTDGTEVTSVATDYATFSQTYLTNPATGMAWTWAEIDALQVGVSLKSAGAYFAQCTQVYVEVTYGLALITGSHTFSSKQYRERIVIPNYVGVNSMVGDIPQYSGYAVDPSIKVWAVNTAYAVGDKVIPTVAKGLQYTCTTAGTSHAATEPTWPTAEGATVADNTVVWTVGIMLKSAFENMRLASNAQATAVAGCIIAQAQLATEGGAASVPLNVGAECLDYVKVVDANQDDIRFGNAGYVHRKVDFRKNKWEMSFGFGGWLANQVASRSLVQTAMGSQLGEGAVTNISLNIIIDVGDTLLHASDGQTQTNSATYVKVKETLIPCYGYSRVKFDMACTYDDSGNVATARIYRNGVALGTERVQTDDTNFVTYSEDFSGFKPGDLLQIYMKAVKSTALLKNFRLYWDNVNQNMPYEPAFVDTVS
jgi:hypothetical protein